MGEAAETVPHPTDPEFALVWGRAWSTDPARLGDFYASDATYTDAAMRTSWHGRAGIADFYRFMQRFIGDSTIEFTPGFHASGGCFTAEWAWSGTASGPLRLRDGSTLDLVGQHLSSTGVAVCTYADSGLLTSHTDYWDLLSMLEPAGVRLTRRP